MVGEEGGEDGDAGEREVSLGSERVDLGHSRLEQVRHLCWELLEPLHPLTEYLPLVEPLLQPLQREELDEDAEGSI